MSSLAGALLALVVFAIAVGFFLLIWFGSRAGDRDDDARVAVRLRWEGRPDGWELQAAIEVTNPSPTPALVSARSNPASAVSLQLREPRSVQIPFRERRKLLATTVLLGAVGQDAPTRWVLPLGVEPEAGAVRVDVRLDQHRRARLMRYLLPVPATPGGRTASQDIRDPQDA